jgi:hypothetical protein
MSRQSRVSTNRLYYGRLAALAAICLLAALGNTSLMGHCLKSLAGQSPSRFFSQIPEPSYPDSSEQLEELAADAAGVDLRCHLGVHAVAGEPAGSLLRHRTGPVLYAARDVIDVLHRLRI